MSQSDPLEKLKKGRTAAIELIPILRNKLASRDGSVHAGTSLYRAFNPKGELPPGTTIKSDEVNKEWESLMNLFEQLNFQKADIPVGRLILAALVDGDTHKPQVEMAYIQKELQDQYNGLMRKYGFNDLDGARAGVVLCSVLFNITLQLSKRSIPM